MYLDGGKNGGEQGRQRQKKKGSRVKDGKDDGEM